MKAGSTSKLAIEWDWIDAPEAVDPAHRATWARVRMACNGHPLFRHVDQNEEVQDDVCIPASSLAEWMARGWTTRFAAERVPGDAEVRTGHQLVQGLSDELAEEDREAVFTWLRATSLLEVGDGLIMPSVIFWRRGDFMVISWLANDEPEDGIRYLSTGDATVDWRQVRNTFLEFMRLVEARLVEALPDARLDPVVVAIRALSAPIDEQFEVLAARLGTSPARLSDLRGHGPRPKTAFKRFLRDVHGIELTGFERAEDLDSEIGLAARSAGPRLTERDLEVLEDLGRTLRDLEPATGLEELRTTLRTPTVHGAEPEYERGYKRATSVRGRLANKADPFDIEDWLSRFGVHVTDVELEDEETDGLSLWNARCHALAAVNVASKRAGTPWGRRATLSHELYHLLFDTKNRAFFGELTRPDTSSPSEPAANAFAAELLLPTAALPRVGTPWNDLQARLEALCNEYGVGRELAIWQLKNRGRMSEQEATLLMQSIQARRSGRQPRARTKT